MYTLYMFFLKHAHKKLQKFQKELALLECEKATRVEDTHSSIMQEMQSKKMTIIDLDCSRCRNSANKYTYF